MIDIHASIHDIEATKKMVQIEDKVFVTTGSGSILGLLPGVNSYYQ